jgi:hypothetical protein
LGAVSVDRELVISGGNANPRDLVALETDVMSYRHLNLVIAATALTLLASGVLAEPPAPAATSGSVVVPIYKPPLRGAPRTRVGGGTRGPSDPQPALYVLAPEHTGLTTQEQPTLYWYISKPARARIEISLADEQSIEPLLETTLEIVSKPGVQSIRLADYGIRLKPGVEYQWSIAIVNDPSQRSQDLVASAGIRLVELGAVPQCSGLACVTRDAERGYWYDAIDSLERLIEAEPGNDAYLGVQKALMKQLVLPEFQ